LYKTKAWGEDNNRTRQLQVNLVQSHPMIFIYLHFTRKNYKNVWNY